MQGDLGVGSGMFHPSFELCRICFMVIMNSRYSKAHSSPLDNDDETVLVYPYSLFPCV